MMGMLLTGISSNSTSHPRISCTKLKICLHRRNGFCSFSQVLSICSKPSDTHESDCHLADHTNYSKMSTPRLVCNTDCLRDVVLSTSVSNPGVGNIVSMLRMLFMNTTQRWAGSKRPISRP